MSDLNIKDFLAYGAFLQTSEDHFKVLIGPFDRQDLRSEVDFKQRILIYKPDFWDFLTKSGHNLSNSSQKTVYAPAKVFTMSREEFICFLSSDCAEKPDLKWGEVSEAYFKEQFDWSESRFYEQKLVKSVPIIKQESIFDFKKENLLWCIKNLIQTKTFGWSYGFFENKRGMLGHTPEILVDWNQSQNSLSTVALAGTYAKDDIKNDSKERLFKEILEDNKIRNEHQIVIQDILNKIKFLSLDFKQGATEVLELKYLIHLITKFQINATTIEQAFQAIEALHPTAAMGIYPYDLNRLKEFSEFKLQKERFSFAAPFAIIEKEAIFCVVAIRNVLFSSDKIQIFSGCGITNDSQYEIELAELESKRESVKKMLGLI